MTERQPTSFRWHFGKKRPDEVERNPIPSEFFVSESRDLADNLVREAIQNALDARRGDSRHREPAYVRFYLSGDEKALPKSGASRWFTHLGEHLQSETSGLKSAPYESGVWEKCPYLVCEDFGTHGLTGDPAQSESAPRGTPSDFYNFFRAEALSSKGDGKGGTWGVGKTVFPMASGANAFIGLTVQEGNSRRLMMGRCILRYHKVEANGSTYRSDGFFGCSPDANGLVMPLRDMQDSETLNDFAADFQLLRGPNDPGLSVVVPWYKASSSGNAGLSIDSLRRAVIQHFFWAITSGALAVSLESSTGTEEVSLDSIHDSLDRLAPDSQATLKPLVALAEWAVERRTRSAVPRLESVCREWASGPPDWKDCLTESDVEPLARRLQEDKRVAVRVPITLVRKRPQQHDQPSYFDVFMEEADEALRPAFHRDLLLICEEPRRPQKVQGFRAVVVADDYNLAHFLSSAEVPSHDHWEPNQQELAVDYAYSPQLLKFVRNSVKHIGTNILDSRPVDVDHTLTMDFFPRVDSSGTEGKTKKGGSEKGGHTTGTTGNLPVRGPALRIGGSDGTVRIRLGPNEPQESTVGRLLHVQLAYNIRRGNPLKNWNAVDFRLEDQSLTLQSKGLSGMKRRDNWIRAIIDTDDFDLTLSGFDRDRDVFVQATVGLEGDEQ